MKEKPVKPWIARKVKVVLFQAENGEWMHVLAGGSPLPATDAEVSLWLLLEKTKAELENEVKTNRIFQPDAVRIGDLRVDYGHGRVYLRGQEIFLTMRQYQVLLRLLAGSATKSDFLAEIWDGLATPASVWNAIYALRQKLRFSNVAIAKNHQHYKIVVEEKISSLTGGEMRRR